MQNSGMIRIGAAFVVGAAVGCACGWWWAGAGNSSVPPAANEVEPGLAREAAPAGRAVLPDTSTNVAAQSMPSGATLVPPSTVDYLTLLNEAARIPERSKRWERMRELLAQWIAADPETAWRYARTQSPFSDREFAIETALQEWAKSDSIHVLGLADELTSQFGRDRAWRWIVHATEAAAPEATIRAIEALPTGRLQAELFGEAAGYWSKKDPYSALAWARTLPEGEAQGRAMEAVFAGWSEVDVKSAAAEAVRLPTSALRIAAMKKVARHYAAVDPYSAIWWMQGLPAGREQKEAWQAMARGGFSDYFEKQSPPVALGNATQLISSLKDDSQKDFLVALVAGTVGRADPEQTRAWVMQLPEGAQRDGAIKSLLSVWSDANPAEALSFALENYHDKERVKYLARIAGGWAHFDSDAALAFAKTLPEGEDRQWIVNGVVESLSRVNPAEAAGLISQLPAGQPRENAARGVLQSWANLDPQAATAWLSQFPESEARTQGYFAVARSWGLNDYPAAAAWIKTQPAGPDRDAAIGAFVQSVDGADIALANQWAATIQDPRQRMQSSERVFGRWLSEDSSDAIDWLQNGQMDPSLRTYLTSLQQQWARRQQQR